MVMAKTRYVQKSDEQSAVSGAIDNAYKDRVCRNIVSCVPPTHMASTYPYTSAMRVGQLRQGWLSMACKSKKMQTAYR